MVCVGLMAAMMADRSSRSRRIDRGVSLTTVRIRMLGAMVWVTLPTQEGRVKRRVACHVKFGFGTPGLQSRVKVALCPSIRLAHHELQRESVDLTSGSANRWYQCGENLQLRRHQLIGGSPRGTRSGYRRGTDQNTRENKGKGGSTRSARRGRPPVKDCPGRSKRGGRQGFSRSSHRNRKDGQESRATPAHC